MVKLFICFLFSLTFVVYVHAQYQHTSNLSVTYKSGSGDSAITTNETVTLDTQIAADYFNVEFTIGERKEYKKVGGKWQYVLVVDLDSARNELKAILLGYGLDLALLLVEINHENPVYGYQNVGQKKSKHTGKIYGSDTVTLLAKELDPERVSGFKVVPVISKEHLAEIKKEMAKQGLNTARKNADSFGKANNLNMDKMHFSQEYFWTPMPMFSYLPNLSYKVDLGKVALHCQISAGFTFTSNGTLPKR